MLDANIKTQLKAYLERVTQPIEIVASLDEGPKSQEMRELLRDVAEQSQLISLTEDGTDEPTPEGELEGKPNQPEGEPQAPPPSGTEVNPDTGFSPEEARQRLRTLADEDKDVRPPINLPIQAEKYKNW